MKKLFLLFLITMMTISFTGCSLSINTLHDNTIDETPNIITNNVSTFELEQVGYNPNYDIYFYRETPTDALYTYKSGYREGGLNEMTDPEKGLPLTYARYMELYNEGNI